MVTYGHDTAMSILSLTNKENDNMHKSKDHKFDLFPELFSCGRIGITIYAY